MNIDLSPHPSITFLIPNATNAEAEGLIVEAPAHIGIAVGQHAGPSEVRIEIRPTPPEIVAANAVIYPTSVAVTSREGCET